MAEDIKKSGKNVDPITGSPGAHPIGTGVGAAAGGVAGVAGGMAAGAAAGTAAGGPAGAAVGAVVGALAGGLAGKAVAEHVNPTEENEYWQSHYTREPYYNPEYSFEDYSGAYQVGYGGYARLGSTISSFEGAEPDLRREYEQNYPNAKLNWDEARSATRAAWHRFHRDLERYIGYDVLDSAENNIGTLDCLWADHTGEPEFVGVRTGWFMGKTHVVPAESVTVSVREQRLRLPYTRDQVKNAPTLDPETEVTVDKENEVRTYYGLKDQPMEDSFAEASTPTPAESQAPREGLKEAPWAEDEPPPRKGRAQDAASLQLAAEQLDVTKHEVEVGGVRLRKIVRTERVNQPVELRREEVVIERVPASGDDTGGQASFEEEEVYIPLRREEAVLQKRVKVREQVRARKESEFSTQTVSDSVRKEDVEIERTGEAREKEGGTRPSAAEDMRAREERPRSQRQQP